MIFRLLDKLAGRYIDWRMTNHVKASEHAEIIKMDIDRSTSEIVMQYPEVAYMAERAAEMLKGAGAENYVQFDLCPRLDRALPWIRVTVQYARGISPAAKAARLETKNAELIAALAKIASEEKPYPLAENGSVLAYCIAIAKDAIEKGKA